VRACGVLVITASHFFQRVDGSVDEDKTQQDFNLGIRYEYSSTEHRTMLILTATATFNTIEGV